MKKMIAKEKGLPMKLMSQETKKLKFKWVNEFHPVGHWDELKKEKGYEI